MSTKSTTSAAPISKRESAKAERKARIIAAARELIRETGDTGLSMRVLAVRAGVSLATPYNLFGSKRAIVLAILDDVREFLERFSRLRRSSALDRFFQALHLTIDYCRKDPDFYRALWSAVLDIGNKEARNAITSLHSNAFWETLIEEAIREGALRADIDPQCLRRNLDLTYIGVMVNWVLGEVTDDELEPLTGYGYSLALHGAASPAQQMPILKKIGAYQRQLARFARRKSTR